MQNLVHNCLDDLGVELFKSKYHAGSQSQPPEAPSPGRVPRRGHEQPNSMTRIPVR